MSQQLCTWRRCLVAVVLMLAPAACTATGADQTTDPATSDFRQGDTFRPGDSSASAPRSSSAAEEITIIALGDSQTAGAWLADPAVESWPAQLGARHCPNAECVHNDGVGGQPLGIVDPTLPPPLLSTLDRQLRTVGDIDVAVVLIGQLDLVASDDIDQILAWYDELDDRLEQYGVGLTLFVSLLPYDTEASSVPEWVPVLDARRTAINEGLRNRLADSNRFVDVEPLLTEPGSAEFRSELAIHDGNHPSVMGARIIADAVNARIVALLSGSSDSFGS